MKKLTQRGKQYDAEADDWCSWVHVSDNYIAYRAKCLSMLPKFWRMWDGRLSQIKEAKHQIELISPDKQPIHSEPCQDGPWAWEFQKQEIDKMFGVHVIKLALMECAPQIMFRPKKDETLRLFVDYCKGIVVEILDLYPYVAWTNVLTLWVISRYTLRWMPVAAAGRWNFQRQIAIKPLSLLMKDYLDSIECHLV